MGKFSPNEKKQLFYNGVIDNKGNIRLDRLKDAEEIIKEKEEKIRRGYNQLILSKQGSALLGLKIFECHIVAIFGNDVYIKCGDEIKQIGYDVVLDYIRNSRYVERI